MAFDVDYCYEFEERDGLRVIPEGMRLVDGLYVLPNGRCLSRARIPLFTGARLSTSRARLARSKTCSPPAPRSSTSLARHELGPGPEDCIAKRS